MRRFVTSQKVGLYSRDSDDCKESRSHRQPAKFHAWRMNWMRSVSRFMLTMGWSTTPTYDRSRLRGMRIEEVITTARSPWQNTLAERLIGSIRRESLDHVIVLGENHLRRILRSYFNYYQRSRTHLSLAKDAPEPTAKQPPECGSVIEIAEVSGLHHRYERRAA